MLGRSCAALALLTVMAAACMTGTAPATTAPALDRARAEALAMQADDLMQAAMAGSAAPLASVFRDRALEMLTAQAQRLAERRMRIEERAMTRGAVHFDGLSLEVVLAVTAQRRVVTPDAADPAWTLTARQWWLRLAFGSARWWVIDERDLPPDQWFAAP